MAQHHITLIPGDGIGPEVAEACCQVLAETGVQIIWDKQLAGLAALEATGKALPPETVTSIRKNGVALKGPTTTPVAGGHGSANVAMRKQLDLYASVRPIKSISGLKTRYDNVDMVIFRENTEGLYAGMENEVCKGVVVSLKVVTEAATRRIAKAAFDYAVKHGRKRVTTVHKANIIKLGDGLFLQTAREVAKSYPQIQHDDSIIDSTCMKLVRDPTAYDILLMENLYGDILSDLCAGLVGGLGVVPGANIGSESAIFEAVHGAAPDIAGQGLANPTALLKSSVLMLEHLSEHQAAQRLDRAIDQVLAKGEIRTRDLGGTHSLSQFTQEIIKIFRSLQK